MSPVARKVNKTVPMSITSLIDILTILLLFIMINVSADPDMVPEGVELEEALFVEHVAENSRIISLNVSYTGRDTGFITYQMENSSEVITIASLSELNNTTQQIIGAKSVALDATLHEILGDNLGAIPVVVKIKAHKNTAFKYINTLKSMLVSIWNDDKSLVRSKVGSKDFKLYFATEFAENESQDYYRLLSSYGLTPDVAGGK